MQHSTRTGCRRTVKVETRTVGEIYPHNLNMYTTPPSFQISLAQMEELAVERLKVLRCLEMVNLKGLAKFSKDWRNALKEEMTKQGLKHYYKFATSPICEQTEEDFQQRKRDHMSHYILRLAYCPAEELRRWFLTRELELFKLKFLSLDPGPVKDFLLLNNLSYSPISQQLKERVKDGLVASTYAISSSIVEKTDFYRVPFTEVTDLIRARRVYVKEGFAFIPSGELVSVLCSLFRSNLSQALTIMFSNVGNLEEDERLLPILRGLHSSYTGDDYTKSKNNGCIDIEDLDKFSRTSYPMCMRQTHETLRAGHHLKYFARLQYGLFLKGIGVTLEDSLRFWRDEFCKKMDLDKFEKSYSYNIRYNYGKEGKRADFTPQSCMKIIMQNIGAGEQHGCPFKHSDPSTLRNKLINYDLPTSAVNEIMDLVQKGHYQLACTKHFEATHNQPPETGIAHPNYFFEQSQAMLGGKVIVKQESQEFPSKHAPPVPSRCKGAEMPTEADMWGNDVDFAALDMDTL